MPAFKAMILFSVAAQGVSKLLVPTELIALVWFTFVSAESSRIKHKSLRGYSHYPDCQRLSGMKVNAEQLQSD